MRALLLVAVGTLWAANAWAQDPAGTPPAEPVQAASEEAAEKGLEHEVIEWEGGAEDDASDLQLPGVLPGHGWVLSWRRGLKLTSRDGVFAFQFGARVLADAGFWHVGGGLEDVTGRSGWDAGGDLSQARLYGQGVFLERFFAKAEVDLEDQVMRDVYGGVRGLGPLGTFQAGFFKAPFSLEEKNSTLALPFLERSLANLFAPKRGSGFSFTNTHLDRRLRWEAGAFFVVEGFNEANENEGFDDTFDLALRVTALPVWEEKEDHEEMLLVGLSYAHRFNITDAISFATRPESSLAPIVADTGLILDADSLNRGSLETAWSDGRRTVQAEILFTQVNRSSLPDLQFWGAYVQASLLLTDDVRRYGRRAGAFGRIVPRRPLDLAGRQWGAVEVAGRLSALDLRDEEIAGGRVINATAAVSWFPFTRLRLTANYVLSHRLGDGFANVIEARIQLDY